MKPDRYIYITGPARISRFIALHMVQVSIIFLIIWLQPICHIAFYDRHACYSFVLFLY